MAVFKYVLAQTQTQLTSTINSSADAEVSPGTLHPLLEWGTAQGNMFHGREILCVLAALAGCKASYKYSDLAPVTGQDKTAKYILVKELCVTLKGRREIE